MGETKFNMMNFEFSLLLDSRVPQLSNEVLNLDKYHVSCSEGRCAEFGFPISFFEPDAHLF